MIAIERSRDGEMWVRELDYFPQHRRAIGWAFKVRAKHGGYVRTVDAQDGRVVMALPFIPPRGKAAREPARPATDDFNVGG